MDRLSRCDAALVIGTPVIVLLPLFVTKLRPFFWMRLCRKSRALSKTTQTRGNFRRTKLRQKRKMKIARLACCIHVLERARDFSHNPCRNRVATTGTWFFDKKPLRSGFWKKGVLGMRAILLITTGISLREHECVSKKNNRFAQTRKIPPAC